MKTLAELKRNIKVDQLIECIAYEGYGDTKIPEKLAGVRKVTHVDTTGFYMKQADDIGATRGSFCGWPKASELSWIGDEFTIMDYDKGVCYLTRTYKLLPSVEDIKALEWLDAQK